MINFEPINISFGDKKILSSSNFQLKKGCFYCFIGKNGSGKTSLFKHIKNKNNHNIRLLQQNQFIDSTYDISVWNYLKSFCVFENIFSWDKLMVEYLNKFELYEKRFQIIDSLSGGEKQRMFLVQTLLGHSDLILLDESFSNLDIEHKIEFYSLFIEEAKSRNIPIILIEHDIRLAIELSSNILFCLTHNLSIKNFKSNSTELKEMIEIEYGITIDENNKYELLKKNNIAKTWC